MEYDLLITIVNRGHAAEVMDAARAKGAKGGTIIYGRGTAGETEKYFNITLQEEKEIVMIVVNHADRHAIMEEISQKAGINTPGRGVMFSIPVDEAIGLAK